MPLHDTSYQHWQGVHHGVWRRRWVIASNGLRGCLQNRWLQYLVVLCWGGGLAVAGILFAIGQLLVPDSVIVQWVGNLGPTQQMFARMLTTWLELHPQFSVGTTQNVALYFFGKYLLLASIFALGMALPHFVTRDLASNAIVIYSSKAISRGDYLLGKFATAAGLVLLTWAGPMCAAWFLGNLLAPDWRFFWHSRAVIGHILVFGAINAALLASLAVGVSAISNKEKSTTALWFTWWVLGAFVAAVAMETRPWLQNLSFSHDLAQIGLVVFRPGSDLDALRENVPVFANVLQGVRPQTLEAISNPPVAGAAAFLVVMLALAALIIRKRVKPE